MDRDKAIRSAKLTAAGVLDKARARTAVSLAGGQIAPSKYLPDVPRQVHAAGGKVAFMQGNHPDVPDVMYHGTGAAKDFTSFAMPGNKTGRKTGGNAIYLSTSPETASTFANYGQNPRVIPAHVSAKNPFDFRNPDHIDALQGALTKNFKSWFPGAMYGPQTAINWMRGGDFGLLENDNVRSWMKRRGHDGYFVTEGEGKPLNLAVFKPEQVKSAISATTFDPTDPDMTRAAGGRIGKAYGGGYVPQAALPQLRLAVAQPLQQQQPQGASWLNTLTDLAVAAKKEPEAPQPQESPSAASEGHAGVSANAQAALDALRKGWTGQDFNVISDYRSPSQNQTAGGAKGSQHLHGNAFDIDTSGWTPEQKLELATQAYNAGFRGFGFYDNNLHFDVGGQRAWGPSYHNDSIPEWAQPWTQQYVYRADGGKVGGYIPQQTVKAYKLFRTKGDGKLYPLFVNAEKPVPMGQWLEAEEGPQGKARGKVKSKLGDLAYRPGWHAGDLPIATHIGGKSDPSLKKPDYRPDNHVWAEVEMAADKDWQSVANTRGKGAKAHITDQVPMGGFYRYKTNPNMTGSWLIGGNMKVNRVMSDDEVKAVNDAAGTADLPRLNEIQKAGGGEVDGREYFDEGGATGDNFQSWFGNSVTHTNGEPHVFYTGTSKDKDFTGFNVGRHGAWFTRDPAVASSYAEQNDSQGYKMDGWRMVKTNTASRVIPAYVKAENPYTGDYDGEIGDNYKKVQSDWFDTLRAKGHDAWMPASQGGNLVVALKEPQQIKSIYNNGKFDPKQKHMGKAEGGSIEAYHGSPHDFDQFDISKINTGEGAQSYGHGLYFAGNEGVAKSYRDALQFPSVRNPSSAVEKVADDLNYHRGNVEGVRGIYEGMVKSGSDEAKALASEKLKAMPEAISRYKGHMYKVKLNVGPHELLDWDKPLSEQHPNVQAALGRMDPDQWHPSGSDYDATESGQMAYHRLIDAGNKQGAIGEHLRAGNPMKRGDKWASEALMAQGIKGIRYRDAGSRGDTDGDPTHNYVMFHHDPVEVTQKYAYGGNVTDITLPLAMKAATSDAMPKPVSDLVGNVNSRFNASAEAYQNAKADGAFDNVRMGDVFRYNDNPRMPPMKVVSHTMRHVKTWGGSEPPEKVYNDHFPVAELERQDSSADVKPYPVEFLEKSGKYTLVGRAPRAVKAGGGEIDGVSNNQIGGYENAQASEGSGAAGTQALGLLGSGGVRGSQGVLSAPPQASGEEDLIGLPKSVKMPKLGQTITAAHDPRIRQVARDYARTAGIDYNPPTTYQKVDPARAKRIADAYEAMPHDPQHPLVKASYDALLRETKGQYDAMKRAGVNLEFYPDVNNDPYKSNPRLAVEDLRHNNHMYVYPTDAGYGTGDAMPGADENPMLRDSGERWNGKPVMFNDLFRAVHDYFGHAKDGVGFRADGEENAWRSHAAMFSPLARIALGTETRGQNSWLNYGPHGDKNRTAATEDTVFAPQKLGVLPPWVHHEGAEFIRPEERAQMEDLYRRYNKAVGGALALTRRFTKDGMAATMSLKSKGK